MSGRDFAWLAPLRAYLVGRRDFAVRRRLHYPFVLDAVDDACLAAGTPARIVEASGDLVIQEELPDFPVRGDRVLLFWWRTAPPTPAQIGELRELAESRRLGTGRLGHEQTIGVVIPDGDAEDPATICGLHEVLGGP